MLIGQMVPVAIVRCVCKVACRCAFTGRLYVWKAITWLSTEILVVGGARAWDLGFGLEKRPRDGPRYFYSGDGSPNKHSPNVAHLGERCLKVPW